MEFALQIDPMYRGPTVNWVDVDKSKLYLHPKFSDKCIANDYSRKYGFSNDPDIDYIKAELKKMGRKPKDVRNAQNTSLYPRIINYKQYKPIKLGSISFL